MNGECALLGIELKEADSAAGRAQDIQHAADGGGLAGAIRAMADGDLAALHLERDVAHGAHGCLARIGLDQMSYLNGHSGRPFAEAQHIYAPVRIVVEMSPLLEFCREK